MKGPNKRENTILLNICTERLEFLNPPSPNQPEKVNEIAILISVLRRLNEYKIPRTFLSKIISIERRNVPRLRNFFSSRNLFPDITAPNHTCLLANRKSHEMS